MHRAPDPHQPQIRPPPAIRTGRERSQADLYRDQLGRGRAGARVLRSEMGRAAAGHHAGLARQLGVRDPVPGLRTRGPPRDLHHQRDRGAQPAAQKGGQDQRPLPHRRRGPQTALPRDPKRRPAMDPDPQLDESAAGVQDPIRRPPTRLTAYTVSWTPSQAIADFEAQLAAMYARLRDLADDRGSSENPRTERLR